MMLLSRYEYAFGRAVARSGITGMKAGLQRAASLLTGGSGAVPPIFSLPSLPPSAAKNDLATALVKKH
jgi:hypothetical protein